MDWREHIDGEPGAQAEPTIKGSGVQVEAVLRLLRDGWTIERVLERFPALSADDVRACLDYAVALLAREKLHAEIRRRIAAGDADPDRGIPLEVFEREFLAGMPRLPEDEDE